MQEMPLSPPKANTNNDCSAGQVFGGEYGPEVDIFALGLVAAEILSGIPIIPETVTKDNYHCYVEPKVLALRMTRAYKRKSQFPLEALEKLTVLCISMDLGLLSAIKATTSAAFQACYFMEGAMR
jgi:hypothetical protein